MGQLLKEGDIICITGELGTGKTVLSKGIAKGAGIDEHITSPTFTIVNEYKSKEIFFYHFDVYRISDPEEMYEIGFEEYLYSDGMLVVEWADLIEDILPHENIWVTIEKDFDLGLDARVISIRFNGQKYLEYEKKLTTEEGRYNENNGPGFIGNGGHSSCNGG